MARFSPPGFGWSCSIPAFEDQTYLSADIQAALRSIPPGEQYLPDEVDLRDFFPPADLQMEEVSSSVHACCGLIEYFERRASGKIGQPSALFVHHAVSTMMQCETTTRCDIRTVLSAINRFGVLPEKYFPYQQECLKTKTDASLYALAACYNDLMYFRIDQRNQSGAATLDIIKPFLAAGMPLVFGFAAPESISKASDIPYRPHYDTLAGGLAVVAVGYDDRHLRASKGALLIRNSWGADWGEAGYGWLPYAYLTEQWAVDCWGVLKNSWLASGEFTRPQLAELTKPI